MPLHASPDRGLDWLGWVAKAAVIRLARAAAALRHRLSRGQESEHTANVAVYPLLWVYPPEEVAALIRRQPGVHAIRLEPSLGVADVTFDPRATSVADLHAFVDDCARHCSGRRSPAHGCPKDLKVD